jgi:hypothetical protein
MMSTEARNVELKETVDKLWKQFCDSQTVPAGLSLEAVKPVFIAGLIAGTMAMRYCNEQITVMLKQVCAEMIGDIGTPRK